MKEQPDTNPAKTKTERGAEPMDSKPKSAVHVKDLAAKQDPKGGRTGFVTAIDPESLDDKHKG